jgi:hypothetical protein
MFVAAMSKSSLGRPISSQGVSTSDWQIGLRDDVGRNVQKWKTPWIGIPTRYHEKSEYIRPDPATTWTLFLWAGGLPLMIPTLDDR